MKAMPQITDNASLFGVGTIDVKEPSRNRKGFHTLIFNGTTLNLLGEQKTLADAFNEIEKLTGTKSPTVVTQKLIVFAYLYNRNLIGKDAEETKVNIQRYIAERKASLQPTPATQPTEKQQPKKPNKT